MGEATKKALRHVVGFLGHVEEKPKPPLAKLRNQIGALLNKVASALLRVYKPMA